MEITKEFKGLIDEGYRYKIEGNLISIESLIINLDKPLHVSGHIKADGSIEAGWSIKAGGSIEAGEHIKAGDGYGISAGLKITSKTTITCNLKLFAGIYTWGNIADEDKTITCTELLGGGIVEYGILNLIEKEEKKEPRTIVVDGVTYVEKI